MVIITCVVIMIPSSLYLKVIGFDLGGALIYSPADDAATAASRSLQETEENAAAKKIEGLTQKVRNGKASDKEKDDLKKLIRERSLWRKVSGSIGDKFSELKEATASAPSIGVQGQAILPPTEQPVAEVERRKNPLNGMCLRSPEGKAIHIFPGDYYLEPSARPGEVKFQLIGGAKEGLQNLGDGRNFTVPSNTKLVGIMSDQPRKIYPGKA